MANSLPEFERPPLDEVVIGVQFEPLSKFHAAHVGLYWSRIRDRYPLTEDQPPLAKVVESQKLEPQPPPSILLQTQAFLPRAWFLNQSRLELIQVQQDRFLRNWRQLEGDEPYPRFRALLGQFRQEWEGFLAFVREENLGEPAVNQCEVNYVNHIPLGAGWNSFSELPGVFTLLADRAGDGSLPKLDFLSWRARYDLPNGGGKLAVEMNPAFRGRDLKLVLVLGLTARGRPASASMDGLFPWFEVAHRWIVTAFDQLTSTEMHNLWKKQP